LRDALTLTASVWRVPCASPSVGTSFLQTLEMPKADELPAFLIPKMKLGRVQAAPDGDGLHILENRMCSVTSLQIIIGDTGAEVMDVVKPNIAREPLESLGQTIERTALEGGNCVIPCFTALPVRPVELMLNVEHPDTNCPGHRRD